MEEESVNNAAKANRLQRPHYTKHRPLAALVESVGGRKTQSVHGVQQARLARAERVSMPPPKLKPCVTLDAKLRVKVAMKDETN